MVLVVLAFTSGSMENPTMLVLEGMAAGPGHGIELLFAKPEPGVTK